MNTDNIQCCICGRDLPNRYAAGPLQHCAEPGCDALFCDLHWQRSNRRCPRHGYQAKAPPSYKPVFSPPAQANSQPPPESTEALPKTSAFRATLEKIRQLALALFRKVKPDHSPEGMLRTVDSALAANTARREPLGAALERQFHEIAAKKKLYEAAPAARKAALEGELKLLLAGYRAQEGEFQRLLENEVTLTQVKGRLNELLAQKLAGVTEADLDKLTDEVADAVALAEGRQDAARDLDQAGRRRERAGESEAFAKQLQAFAESAPPTATPAAEPPPPTTEKPTPAKELEPPET
jgi:hypothetical protein